MAQSSAPKNIQIRTRSEDPDESLIHRYEAIQRARDELNAGNNTETIVKACDHVRADKHAKRQAIKYLVEELPAPQVEHVCELLSTSQMQISIEPREIAIE